MTGSEVCHHAASESKRSRTVQSEGSGIGWELVVPLFTTVELLNDHCVYNYQAIYLYILSLMSIAAFPDE